MQLSTPRTFVTYFATFLQKEVIQRGMYHGDIDSTRSKLCF